MLPFIIIPLLLIVGSYVAWLISASIRNDKLLKSVTAPDRGHAGERRLLLKLLKLGIPPTSIYHDVYLHYATGRWTQIDCVVMLETCVLVIEHKDYKGWIYGNCQHRQWTQVFNYGKKKYKFYNPIFQNQQHIRALQSQVNWPIGIPVQSVIIFSDHCKLKRINQLPNNVWLGYEHNFLEQITSFQRNKSRLTSADMETLTTILQQGVRHGNHPTIVASHRQQIRGRVK